MPKHFMEIPSALVRVSHAQTAETWHRWEEKAAHSSTAWYCQTLAVLMCRTGLTGHICPSAALPDFAHVGHCTGEQMN